MARALAPLRQPVTRLRNWWLARLPATAEHVLTHRNLYVLPTRAGWMLGITLLLLLVGSINYQLNLGYLLTFLLAGSVAVGVHVGHFNLRGLRLTAGVEDEAYAGRSVMARLQVSAPDRRDRWAVALQWTAPGAEVRVVDVPAGDAAAVPLPLVFPTRGRHPLPPLRLETRYPMGAFRLWSWWRPAGTVLVYPAPEVTAPPLPPCANRRESQDTPETHPVSRAAGPADDLPDAVRSYRVGDLPARVLWKKAAGRDDNPAEWLVREATPAAGTADLWLDDAACGLSDVEARRARLCAWVLQADARGLRYGLRLPGLRLEPDAGPAQRRRCLEALACH